MKLKKKTKKKATCSTVILDHCNFKGSDVHYSPQVIEAVQTIAEGLTNLAKLFNTQNISTSPLLKIEQLGKKPNMMHSVGKVC